MTPAEFKAEYPEFAAVSDAVIQRQIDLFACLYKGDYGCSAEHLEGLFVAHQLFVKTKRGGGPVQAMTNRAVGDVSTGFAQSSGTEKAEDFASSKYGLEFFRMLSLFGSGPLITSNRRVIPCRG